MFSTQRIQLQVFLLSAFVFLLNAFAQAQVVDDFSDGNFNSNPEWLGTNAAFIVNGDGQLQLMDSDAGQSYLSTSLNETDLNNKEWRFYIKQSFSGSSNNYSRFYLSSNTSDLSFSGSQSLGANGYFLLFGESGSDDAIRLFRDDNEGDGIVEILSASLGQISSSFELSVRVVRDDLGN